MNTARLAWCLLTSQGMRHLITTLIIALGVGLMLASVATATGARNAVSSLATRFPLVVGGEVGAVPLVLGSITRTQDLPPAVDSGVFEALEHDDRVEMVIPLLGGHAVQGYPLLATTPRYLEPRSRHPLTSGRGFERNAPEVVLGHLAAQGLDASLGDYVVIEHQHPGAPGTPSRLKVVGVLAEAGTDQDRSLFCPLEAIHASHGHDGASGGSAVSSLLIRPADDMALLSLQEELDALPGLEVALTGQTLRRLSDQFAAGGQLIRVLVGGVILITILSLLLSVYGSSLAQARDIAVMRLLGASRARVIGVLLMVTMTVIVSGVLGGVALAEIVGNLSERLLREELGLEASVSIASSTALGYVAATTAVLSLVGLQPAVAAYRIEAADALAEVPGSGRASRSHMTWSLRFVLAGALFLGGLQVMGQHGAEIDPRPLEPESAATFQLLGGWSSGEMPDSLKKLNSQDLSLEGYMYTLGDPFTVQDFYLVAINPRLPRCPFCYRSPTRRERVHVLSGGRSLDVCAGLVRVRGEMVVDPAAADPYSIVLDELEVVIP
jgi:putative ABC transport system permease protein